MPVGHSYSFRESSLDEKMNLSPFEKWRRYRIFPWKFFIHVAIWLLLVVQIIIPVYFIDENLSEYMNNFDATYMPEFSFSFYFTS